MRGWDWSFGRAYQITYYFYLSRRRITRTWTTAERPAVTADLAGRTRKFPAIEHAGGRPGGGGGMARGGDTPPVRTLTDRNTLTER